MSEPQGLLQRLLFHTYTCIVTEHVPSRHQPSGSATRVGRIAGADIKDKQPLLDARKSIERDMERFKACEKEAKNKGPGAGRAADADPKQRAKDEARDWINNCVDTMTEKVSLQHVLHHLPACFCQATRP